MGTTKPVVFIVGNTGQGKTTLSKALNNKIANSKVIHCDVSYINFALNKGFTEPGSDLGDNIAPHYSAMSNESQMDFMKWLYDEIKKLSVDYLVIVEGWHLLFYIENYIRLFREAASPCVRVYVNGREVYHNNKHLGHNLSPATLDTISRMVDYEGKRILTSSSMTVEELLSRTTYQHFSELGQGASNSRSLEKLLSLRLPENMGWCNVLDVGCNTGYHVIKMGQRSAYVDGIDIGFEPLLTAEQYAKSVFSLPNVRFYHEDIFDCSSPYRYDWITCLSAFHYFRERQQLFFDLCYKMLDDGGKLVVETGIVEEEPENSSYVKLYSRGVDDKPCYFPNHATLKKMGSAYGKVEYIGGSPTQPGDVIPRHVYMFTK